MAKVNWGALIDAERGTRRQPAVDWGAAIDAELGQKALGQRRMPDVVQQPLEPEPQPRPQPRPQQPVPQPLQPPPAAQQQPIQAQPTPQQAQPQSQPQPTAPPQYRKVKYKNAIYNFQPDWDDARIMKWLDEDEYSPLVKERQEMRQKAAETRERIKLRPDETTAEYKQRMGFADTSPTPSASARDMRIAKNRVQTAIADVGIAPGDLRATIKQVFEDKAIPLPDGSTREPTELDRLRAGQAIVKLPENQLGPGSVISDVMRSSVATRDTWMMVFGAKAISAANRIKSGKWTPGDYAVVAGFLDEGRKLAEQYDEMPWYEQASEGVLKTLEFASALTGSAGVASAVRGKVAKSIPGMAGKVAGEVVGESARMMAAPGLAQMAAGGGIANMAPQGIDQEGLQPGDPFLEAFTKAAGKQLISQLTERSGEALLKLPGLKQLKTVVAKRLGINPGEIRTAAEWSGPLVESIEERVEDVSQGLYSGAWGDKMDFGATGAVLSGDPERMKQGLKDVAIESLVLGTVGGPGMVSDVARGQSRKGALKGLRSERVAAKQTAADFLRPDSVAAWVADPANAAAVAEVAAVEKPSRSDWNEGPESWRKKYGFPFIKGEAERKQFADLVRGVLAQPAVVPGEAGAGGEAGVVPVPVVAPPAGTVPAGPPTPEVSQPGTPPVGTPATPAVPPGSTQPTQAQPTGQAGDSNAVEADQADWKQVQDAGGVDVVRSQINAQLKAVQKRLKLVEPENRANVEDLIRRLEGHLTRLDALTSKFHHPSVPPAVEKPDAKQPTGQTKPGRRSPDKSQVKDEAIAIWNGLKNGTIGKDEAIRRLEAIEAAQVATQPTAGQQAGLEGKGGVAAAKEPWQMTLGEIEKIVKPGTREELQLARPILKALYPPDDPRISANETDDPWGIYRAITIGDEIPRVPVVDLSLRHRQSVQNAMNAGLIESHPDYPGMKAETSAAPSPDEGATVDDLLESLISEEEGEANAVKNKEAGAVHAGGGPRVPAQVQEGAVGQGGERVPGSGSPGGEVPGEEAEVQVTPEAEYDAAIDAARDASKAFTKVQKAYRAREIGDDEFLAGKKLFDESQKAFDAAERKFIDTKNAPVVPPAETPPVVEVAPVESPVTAPTASVEAPTAKTPNRGRAPKTPPVVSPVPEGLDPVFYRKGQEAAKIGVRNPEASGAKPGSLPWKSWVAGNEDAKPTKKVPSKGKPEVPAAVPVAPEAAPPVAKPAAEAAPAAEQAGEETGVKAPDVVSSTVGGAQNGEGQGPAAATAAEPGGRRPGRSNRPPLRELGATGKRGRLNTASGKVFDVEYLAVEADDLIPSHDARRNFTKNEGGDANERPYHDPKEGMSSRLTVQQIAEARDDKLALLVSDNETPTDGPPMVVPDGVVLGGNARTMGIQLGYFNGGEAATKFKRLAVDSAKKYDIDPTKVEAMKEPIIIRVLEGVTDRGEMSRLLNKPLSAGKSAATEAVSVGARISQDTAEAVSSMLEPRGEAGAPSLRDVLADSRKSNKLVRALQADGAWGQDDVDRFVNPNTGELTDAGKAQIEEALLGRIIADSKVVGGMLPGERRMILSSLGPLSRIAAHPKHGKRAAEIVRLAVEAFPGYKAADRSIQDYFFRQTSMIDMPGQGDESVAAVVNAMDTRGTRGFKNGLEDVLDSLGIKAKQKGLIPSEIKKTGTIEEAIAEVFPLPPPPKKKGKQSKAAEPEAPAKPEAGKGKGAGPARRGGPGVSIPVSPTPVGKTPSTGEVVRQLSENFGVPVRTGHFAGPHAGIYKEPEDVARTKGYGKIAVTTHEVAHHLDSTGGVLSNWRAVPAAARDELKALDYNPTRGDIHEGFAEYVRHRLTMDDAATVAPQFDAWFNTWLAGNQNAADAFDKSKAVVDQWRQAGSLARVEAQIDMGETLWEKVGKGLRHPIGTIKTVKDWINDNWINRLAPLLRVSKQMVGASTSRQVMQKMAGDYNFWAFAKVSNMGASSKARAWAETGVADVAGNRLGHGLRETLAPIAKELRDKVTLRQFYAYCYARHALDVLAQGKEPGILKIDAQNVVAQFDSRPGWQAAADGITAWHGALVDYLVDAGGLSQEVADTMRAMYPHYISLARKMDSEFAQDVGGGGARYANLPSGVMRLKGSGREIQPPLESALAYAERIIGIADKVRVGRMLVEASEKYGTLGDTVEKVDPKMVPTSARLESLKDQLEKAGADLSTADMDALLTIFSQDVVGDPKDNIVVLWRGGKRELYYVRDDLYRALTAYGKPFRMPAILDQTAGRIRRTITLGATGVRAGFSLITNPLRDVQTAMMQTEYQGRNPASIVANTIGGFVKDIAGSEVAQLWARGGGQMAQPLSEDRRFLKETIQELTAQSPKDKALNWARHPVDSLRSLFSLPEAAPRLAEFEAALRSLGWRPGMKVTFEQYIKAQLAAANVTVDFREGGTLAMWINQLVPFFNANIQGQARIASAIRNRPIATTVTGLLWMTLPALALWWKQKDEEWYKKLTPMEKGRYWHVKIPGTETILRIPRPFEWGHLFASMPEAAMESAYRQNKKAFTEELVVALDDMTPSIIPGILEAPIEVAANRNFFRDAPLVSERLQNVRPEDQHVPDTSETAKMLGRITGMSPIKMEHLAEGWTGGLATDVVKGVESTVGAATHKTKRQVIGGASTLPVVGRLFLSPLHDRSINDFYTKLEQLEQDYGSARLGKKSSTTPAELHRFRQAAEKLSDLRARSRLILEDKALKDEQKRSEFMDIQKRMSEIANNAMGLE
jgi:hypothetical protein